MVTAGFHDAAVVDYTNGVCFANGAQPVGNDDGCTVC